ncbi:MAG: hypothetical protein U9O83_04495 [Campylobacterota bacterium]|nr:hypothetical protein [Campylobacterota bacterium]
MQKDIILLKQRIDKNHRKIQRKFPLTKIVLKEIDNLIALNASDKVVCAWLKDYDNAIFSLEKHLKNIEDSTTNKHITQNP